MLEVLDTFIGLFTIYLILSLIVTAMGEGVSVHPNLKGRTVRDIVTNLLGKDDGTSRKIYGFSVRTLFSS